MSSRLSREFKIPSPLASAEIFAMLVDIIAWLRSLPREFLGQSEVELRYLAELIDGSVEWNRS